MERPKYTESPIKTRDVMAEIIDHRYDSAVLYQMAEQQYLQSIHEWMDLQEADIRDPLIEEAEFFKQNFKTGGLLFTMRQIAKDNNFIVGSEDGSLLVGKVVPYDSFFHKLIEEPRFFIPKVGDPVVVEMSQISVREDQMEYVLLPAVVSTDFNNY